MLALFVEGEENGILSSPLMGAVIKSPPIIHLFNLKQSSLDWIFFSFFKRLQYSSNKSHCLGGNIFYYKICYLLIASLSNKLYNEKRYHLSEVNYSMNNFGAL